MSTELEQKWRAEFEAHSHPKLHRSWQYMTTFERECQLSLMETYWTYYLAACERRHAEAEALREQLRQCRVYLRGCMNHAFDDTPIVEVAKDVTEEFHRNRLQMQNQRKENEALRAENARLREALEKIFALGHNDDCIFCGLKDRTAQEALGREED